MRAAKTLSGADLNNAALAGRVNLRDEVHPFQALTQGKNGGEWPGHTLQKKPGWLAGYVCDS